VYLAFSTSSIGKGEYEGFDVFDWRRAGAGYQMVSIADQRIDLSLRGKGVRGCRDPSQDIAFGDVQISEDVADPSPLTQLHLVDRAFCALDTDEYRSHRWPP
jgi:hypothetical protein